MKKLAFALFAAMAAIQANAADKILINGAGATFPYPIYSKWFDDYSRLHPEIQINYQSIGSGGGISNITNHTVDFGASDGPMNDEQLAKLDGKLLHIPTVLGAVVPVYNLEGVKDLKLSPAALSDIFLGKVTNWNDAEIKADNPGITLPDSPITVVHRSDGSGTSFCFTDYLSKVNPQWLKNVGRATSVQWPVGLGGKGNEGVSGLVKQTPGSVGYVELIYALQNKIDYASVKNASGKFVKADLASVSAAAAGVKMPKDYRVSITDASGKNAYPIATFTWLLVYQANKGGTGKVMHDFLKWMISEGQKSAPTLGYAPLPKGVAAMVKKTIETVK